MFGGLTLTERVDLDYARARRRAVYGGLKRVLGIGGGDLRDFEVERKSLGSYGTRRTGVREIEVDRIVGSIGRHKDFDGDFMPTSGRLRRKWMRIARLFWTGEEFQPIRVYRLRGEYYVEDGNHRVSVAKFHGVAMLDAEVTELVTESFVGLGSVPAREKGRRLV